VAQVTMPRPAVFNAFDEAMIAELDAAFAAAGGDASVRVIVLAGDGKHFSAGADLQWMQRASRPRWNGICKTHAALPACWRASTTAPNPRWHACKGAALGGGVGLACACDIAVAADNASFAVSEAKFGILPAVIGPYVTNAVGKRQALRLALTTTRIGRRSAQPWAWCTRWCR
jgi:methylglutaconyl-CoA hydratase